MNSTTVFHTGLYKLSHARYFAILVREILRVWWSVPTLLIVVLSVAAYCDLRFGIVLLLLLFVVLPLCVFFLYYNYALRPECFYSVVEKSVTLHRGGIDCVYGGRDCKVLDWHSVRRVVTVRDAYLFYTERYAFFYLPFSAFDSVEELQFFSDEWLPSVIAKNRDC